jgi:NUMOD3 motif
MDYRKIYVRLIRKAEDRKLNCYSERHHVFPRSIYGDNQRIVKLTAREHYVAHLLLWKYYKKKCGEKDKKTLSMLLAINGMLYGQNKERKINSRLFESLRKKAAQAISLKLTGVSKTDEHKQNIRLSKLGSKNPAYGKFGEQSKSFGTQRTEEQKKKLSEIRRSPNNPLRNIPRTDEVKQKIKSSCSHRMTPIERIDKETGEVKEYDSLNDAVRDGFSGGHIHACMNNKRVSHKGYYWNYL